MSDGEKNAVGIQFDIERAQKDNAIELRRFLQLRRRQWCVRTPVEDLVQDTWLRVWRHRDRYDPARGSIGAFVTTVAASVIADTRRREARRLVTVELTETTLSARPDDAEGIVDDALFVRGLLQAVSPSHRRAVELSYLADLPLTQVAHLTGVAVGTVKSRSHCGLRALRCAAA